jgi:hypothetical protein
MSRSQQVYDCAPSWAPLAFAADARNLELVAKKLSEERVREKGGHLNLDDLSGLNRDDRWRHCLRDLLEGFV